MLEAPLPISGHPSSQVLVPWVAGTPGSVAEMGPGMLSCQSELSLGHWSPSVSLIWWPSRSPAFFIHRRGTYTYAHTSTLVFLSARERLNANIICMYATPVGLAHVPSLLRVMGKPQR